MQLSHINIVRASMPLIEGKSEMDIHHMSLERLLQLAFGYALVEHYRLFSSNVEIYLSDGTFLACNPVEARFFVRGLIHGYRHRHGEVGDGSNLRPENNPTIPST
jgi:hypothetical protein